jgi:hypothetical protein
MAWAKARRLPSIYLTNCRTVILLVDRLEENCAISPLEYRLHLLAKLSLSKINASHATYWRQRAKIKHCVLGDENSHYFHLCASGRLRNNQLKVLNDGDGNPTFSHDAKAHIVHSFFHDLLGEPRLSSDSLDLHPLIRSTSLDSTQAASLIRPFSESELRTRCSP